MALHARILRIALSILLVTALSACINKEKQASSSTPGGTPDTPPIVGPGPYSITGKIAVKETHEFDPTAYTKPTPQYTQKIIIKFKEESANTPESKRPDLESIARILKEQGISTAALGEVKAEDLADEVEERNTPEEIKKSFARISSKDSEKKLGIEDINKVVRALQKESAKKNSAIEYVQPEFYRQRVAIDIKDADFDKQWGLSENFLDITNQGWDSVFENEREMRVAVIDTGYRPHKDLEGKILTDLGYDFISDKEYAADGDGLDPDPTDMGDVPGGGSFFHGTFVAGIIAAARNNDLSDGKAYGITGIGTKIKIIHVRVLGKEGLGSDFDISQGIKYAAGLPNASGRILGSIPEDPERRADVINLSLAGYGEAPVIHEAIKEARRAGVAVVCAAGNYGDEVGSNYKETPLYPAAYEECISVGALSPTIGDTYKRAPYSDYDMNVKIMAPGGASKPLSISDDLGVPEGIASTYWNSTPRDKCTGSRVNAADIPLCSAIDFYSGTSFAAPHVAGIIALMRSVNESLTVEGIESIIYRTAKNDNPISPNKLEFGYGIVNALSAVEQAQNAKTNTDKFFVRLKDAETGKNVATAESGSSSDFTFKLEKVPKGIYFLHAGTDYDGNGVICEKGEKFGRYPVSSMDEKPVFSVEGGAELKDITIEIRPILDAQPCKEKKESKK